MVLVVGGASRASTRPVRQDCSCASRGNTLNLQGSGTHISPCHAWAKMVEGKSQDLSNVRVPSFLNSVLDYITKRDIECSVLTIHSIHRQLYGRCISPPLL